MSTNRKWVVFKGADGKEKAILSVGIASLLHQGLMHRLVLPFDEGLMFAFDVQDDWKFWMKNTYIPLDVVFVGADAKVVGIIEDAQPLSEDTLSIGKPSLHVFEVNSGWVSSHKIEVGDSIEIVGEAGSAGKV
jgi:uncharacterized protein